VAFGFVVRKVGVGRVIANEEVIPADMLEAVKC
jgi:hypothetical protein